ncbi:MAG: protein-glutamate O-methyltransferase CheR [Halobacteriaceae archaeon]
MAMTDGFERLVSYIEEEVEFATSYYNDAYLDRRISARMRRTDSEDYGTYLRLLRDDQDERAALLDFLSVNVTSFFRNPEVWEALRPLLAESTSGRGRTEWWSAPCSDGREPYSLAMLALDDDGVDTRRLSITGSDIDREALATARRGCYETTRTTDVAAELEPLSTYEPYVDRDGDAFSVRDRVKELVTFDHHDLIRGDPRSGFDLVLCRNLFIYIDPAYKRPVFETIRDSLESGGYLVIGKTETMPKAFRDAFEPVDKTNRIYRKQ